VQKPIQGSITIGEIIFRLILGPCSTNDFPHITPIFYSIGVGYYPCGVVPLQSTEPFGEQATDKRES
jgi:hypothetical protein